MEDHDQDAIEALIDKYGIDKFLYHFENICHAKADHLTTNWQDSPTAAEWKRLARSIDHIRVK